MITTPNTTSRGSTFRLCTIGSTTLTNTGVVASVASATDTLLTLMLAKNAIQCAAAVQPTKATFHKLRTGNR